MAYGRITVEGVFSNNANYSDPITRTSGGAQESTPASFYSQILTVPTVVPGLNLDLSASALNLAAVSTILIKNLGTTNSIKATWLSDLETIANPGGVSTTAGFSFNSSGSTITDKNSQSSFANTEVGDSLYTGNATNSDNRGTRKVTTVTSVNEVAVSSALVTSANDEAATFSRGKECSVIIAPGRWMVVPGNLMYRTAGASIFEMYIVAISGTSQCEVLLLGT